MSDKPDVKRDPFRLDDLPELLREALVRKQVFDPADAPHPLDSNVSELEALELYSAVRQIRPERSLEVGLAHGISALAILAGLAANGSGHHFVIDPLQPNYGGCGEAMIERAGFSSLHTFFERFPEEVVPHLPRIQFALIDSSHLFDFTLMEFVLIDKKLDPGGFLAFHDLWMPSIQTVVRFVLTNRAYKICHAFSEDGPKPLVRQRCKEFVGQSLSKIPGARRVLRPEVLVPWSTFRAQNLMLLQKISDDQRDWRFHREF
jgi:predicted O-methyltransferase YrrM